MFFLPFCFLSIPPPRSRGQAVTQLQKNAAWVESKRESFERDPKDVGHFLLHDKEKCPLELFLKQQRSVTEAR